jgi:aminoglycoside phosphotransferase (APT) family kinase protein
MPDPNSFLSLYTHLADWWHLLSPIEDYDEEAAEFTQLLLGACVESGVSPPRTLLELGSGGGNNASFLKQHFTLTLVDVSEGMLAASRRINPGCEHLQGDMRTVRLERQFDAVFIHDAIDYMTSEADLLSAMRTAYLHLRPGGAALFVPDHVRETFAPTTDSGGSDGADGRGVRYVEWTYDPDPTDSTYLIDIAYLLRQADGSARVEDDRHICGLFSRAAWLRLLHEAGFQPRTVKDGVGREIFLCIRPGVLPTTPSMIFDGIQPAHLARIRAISPELEIVKIQVNDEGLANRVVIVNDEMAFRFARSPQAAATLEGEARLLDYLAHHLPLPIPRPFHNAPGEMAYALLKGQTLSRDLLKTLPAAVQQKLADQLGGFLRTLHTTPVDASLPETSAPISYEAWEKIRHSTQEKVYPLLLPHQRQWAEAVFDDMLGDPDAFKYDKGLCHGDIGPYHILYDPEIKSISGIIDFGVAGLGDPAMDIGNLLQIYGETFLGKFQHSYPQLPALMRRARFYACAIELEWVLNGLESRKTFWYTAHIGNARDF